MTSPNPYSVEEIVAKFEDKVGIVNWSERLSEPTSKSLGRAGQFFKEQMLLMLSEIERQVYESTDLQLMLYKGKLPFKMYREGMKDAAAIIRSFRE